MSDEPFCARCKEDAPLADEPARWRMGFLRPLKLAPAGVISRVGRDWLEHDQGAYLCGNCYFDLTDDL